MAEEIREPAKDVEELIEEFEAPTRQLTGRMAALVTALAVFLSLYSLYGARETIIAHIFRAAFLLLALVLTFFLYPSSKKWRTRVPWFDFALVAAATVAIGYIFVDFETFIYRAVTPNSRDLLFGAITIVLILEATRRTVGWHLSALTVLFLVYAYVGPWLPPPWTHRGYDIGRLVGHMYMTLEGIFGVPIDVASSFIILFTIYGAVLDFSGAGKFFVDFSFSALGRKPTGAGRTVTLASFLLGGPSGSGVATTVTLGSIAYPMLKKAGYDRESAGGILSAGGIGAVLSPPVLGAASFLIAEFLKISYLQVITMSLVPTLLYYLSIFLMIELDARKFGIKEVQVEAPSLWELTTKYWYHFTSLFAIVVFMVMGFTAIWAVFWASILAVIFSVLRPETALVSRRWLLGFAVASIVIGRASQSLTGEAGLPALFLLLGLVALAAALGRRRGEEAWVPTKLVKSLDSGARQVLSVAATCACAGIIVGVFTLTGLGLKLSLIIVSLAGGSLFLTLVYAAIAVWLLGLALPITASYIVAVVMIGPALIKLGVPDFAAHMFVFYYAILSEVSPPVGLSAFAAAAITGGNPYKTMMMAWKYTLPAFIVPFMFTINPAGVALLLQSDLGSNLWISFTAMVGITALVSGVGGWLLRRATQPERVLLTVAGLLLIYPAQATDLVGVALFAVVVLWQWFTVRRQRGRQEGAAVA